MNKLHKNTDAWKKKAENDLTVVSDLFDSEHDLFDIICFHAQQGAEKYLKALMVDNGLTPPKIHDLGQLLKLMKKLFPEIKELYSNANWLSRFAVESRYPSALDLSITKQDTQKAKNIAEKIKIFCLKKMENNY
ncbi:MAG: HEPN domain-containing protein [Verrucomicrobiota bacterium]|nr:HEPN domain-containing protein [Verrucomicrobiota bacterium]